MTDLLESSSLAESYPPFTDPVVSVEQEVRWSYWPVAFQFGDPTVISSKPLPLSGVKMSEVMRGVGELRAQLQLNDDEVRALYPWDKIVPRKTGIVAVREAVDPVTGTLVANHAQLYLVWAAPRDITTGRMSIMAQTVESLWARRLITKAITWTAVDQIAMIADLLDPADFSQVALGPNPWTGWINVDPPTVMSGVTRTFSYADRQETNLLEAHQNRSTVANGYEWRTALRVLSGTDLANANTYRVQYVTGYPRLGRQIGDVVPVPRLTFDTNGTGNVLDFKVKYDGSVVPNIVWGRGSGYEDLQTKSLITNPEWITGFLQTEARFSDPDVKVQATLDDYTTRHLYERLMGEQLLVGLRLRGDLPPYFGSYFIGDDIILSTNDRTWPTDFYGLDGFFSFASRIYGWTITPPQGKEAETIDLLVTGGDLS